LLSVNIYDINVTILDSINANKCAAVLRKVHENLISITIDPEDLDYLMISCKVHLSL